MGKPAKTKQVTLYLPLGLARQVQAEGVRRRRKMGPAVIEILLEHFKNQADIEEEKLRAEERERALEERFGKREPVGEVAEG